MADHEEEILDHLSTPDYTDPDVAKAYTLFPYNQAIQTLVNNNKIAQDPVFVSGMFADVIVALATQTTSEDKTAQLVDATAWVPKQMRLTFKKIQEYMKENIKTPDWVAEIKTQRATRRPRTSRTSEARRLWRLPSGALACVATRAGRAARRPR